MEEAIENKILELFGEEYFKLDKQYQEIMTENNPMTMEKQLQEIRKENTCSQIQEEALNKIHIEYTPLQTTQEQ